MRTRFEGRMGFGDDPDWEDVLVAFVPWCEGGLECAAGARAFVGGVCPSCGTRITIRVYPPAELAGEGTGRPQSRLALLYTLAAADVGYVFGECPQCKAFTEFFNEGLFEVIFRPAKVVATNISVRLPEKAAELLA